MKLDFHVLQLLSSRICHDLIGSVGSLRFAIDILKEDNSLENEESLDIAVTSINNMINRLTFFRQAYGAASMGFGELGLQRAEKLVHNLFQEKEAAITWDEGTMSILKEMADNENLKVFLNVFLLIFYAVQRDIKIEVCASSLDESEKIGVAFLAKGLGLKISEDNLRALELKIGDTELTPRNIHSFFLGKLAKEHKVQIEVCNHEKNSIQIACTFNKNIDDQSFIS